MLSHVQQLSAARGPCSPHLPSPCRKGGSGPRRSLSVEDIGAPSRLHAVGRVVEVFPDGTSQLELQRPPHGAFGFYVTSGHGRPDKGTMGSSQSFPQTLREAQHGPSTVALVPPQDQACGWVEGAAASLLSPKGVMVDGGMLPHVWFWPHTVPHVHQPLAWHTQPVPKAVYSVCYCAAPGHPHGTELQPSGAG